MAPPYIHQDIIDETVYHLRYDLATLKACSTVSRAFFSPTRRLLLSRIVLTLSTLDRFQSLLEKSPEVREFVNTIDVHTILFVLTPTLSTFLLSFTQLRHLVVGSTSRSFDWSYISPEQLELLGVVIRSGTLYSLKLICAHYVPISFFLFLSASSIRSLILEEALLHRGPDDDHVPLISLKSLTALHLDSETMLGKNYWESFVTPNLRCLSITGTDRYSTENLEKIIAAASNSIQDIIWHQYPSDIDIHSSCLRDVQLAVLSNLKSLSLITPKLSNLNSPFTATVWSTIMIQVESHSVTKNLEIFSLGIVSNAAVDPEYHLDDLFSIPKSFWHTMDAVFSNVLRCPKLRQVEFDIESRYYHQRVGEGLLLNIIAGHLPNLPRSVSLSVKTHDNRNWRISL